MPTTVTQANLLLPPELVTSRAGGGAPPGMARSRRTAPPGRRVLPPGPTASSARHACRNGSSMSVRITCLGWHWYPYRYSKTVDDDDGRPVAPFPTWLGRAREQGGRATRLEPRPAAEACDSLLFEVERGSATSRSVRTRRGTAQLVCRSAPRWACTPTSDEPSDAPVVSVSLGDSCIFRFGTPESRGRPWVDTVLASGDLVVFGGPSRRAYHGVPRLLSRHRRPGAVGSAAGGST